MARRNEPGYIYILSNPCFTYLKIGHTGNSAQFRCDKLSRMQAIPLPFKVEAAYKVIDAVAAERMVHKELQEHLVAKEFYTVDLSFALSTINRLFPGVESEEDEIAGAYE